MQVPDVLQCCDVIPDGLGSLRQVPDCSGFPHIPAAALQGQLCAQHSQQRGFATAVGSYETEPLPWLEVVVEVSDNLAPLHSRTCTLQDQHLGALSAVQSPSSPMRLLQALVG